MDSVVYNSPIGNLTISAENDAIVEIAFGIKEGITSTNNSAIIKECQSQLDDYFSGSRKTFDLPIRLMGTAFQNKVWTELQQIPFGKSISYSELAVRLGDIKSIRAAGTANGKNKLPIVIPCHRVIGKDGSLVGFAGGLDKKRWLLKHEGVIKGEQIALFD